MTLAGTLGGANASAGLPAMTGVGGAADAMGAIGEMNPMAAMGSPAAPTMPDGSPTSAMRRGKKAQQQVVDAGDAEGRTTVMLRNLPNNYSRTMLLKLLNSQGLASRYDF